MAGGLSYRLAYEPGARDLVRQLPPAVKPLVKRAIEGLRTDPYAGKELKLELAGYRSLRARRYRVIYRVHERRRLTEIHYFGPRSDVYELFLRRLRGHAGP